MLQEIKKYKLALSLIALLLSIKFVFVPIFEWQDEKLLEVGLLQKQVSRIHNVLDNRQEIERYAESLSRSLQQKASLFLSTSNVSTFQLEQQQWLEKKIKEFGLKANNIGWSPSQTFEGINLVAHNMQVNLNGNTSSIVEFIQELQKQQNYIAIQAFNISFKQQSNLNLGSGRMRLNLIIYRQETDS
jgi:hypothetical protein